LSEIRSIRCPEALEGFGSVLRLRILFCCQVSSRSSSTLPLSSMSAWYGYVPDARHDVKAPSSLSSTGAECESEFSVFGGSSSSQLFADTEHIQPPGIRTCRVKLSVRHFPADQIALSSLAQELLHVRCCILHAIHHQCSSPPPASPVGAVPAFARHLQIEDLHGPRAHNLDTVSHHQHFAKRPHAQQGSFLHT
jgi:hypothetical protein